MYAYNNESYWDSHPSPPWHRERSWGWPAPGAPVIRTSCARVSVNIRDTLPIQARLTARLNRAGQSEVGGILVIISCHTAELYLLQRHLFVLFAVIKVLSHPQQFAPAPESPLELGAEPLACSIDWTVYSSLFRRPSRKSALSTSIILIL